jgi:hypothetical protein
VVAPPELLLNDLVLEPVVLLELPLEGDAAGVALGELEALDGQVGEGLEEELRVAGLDVLVNIGRSLLEDEGPELGDLGDDLLATDVEVPGELILLADLLLSALREVNSIGITHESQAQHPQSHPRWPGASRR